MHIYNKPCCVATIFLATIAEFIKTHLEEERRCFTKGTNIIGFVKRKKVKFSEGEEQTNLSTVEQLFKGQYSLSNFLDAIKYQT